MKLGQPGGSWRHLERKKGMIEEDFFSGFEGFSGRVSLFFQKIGVFYGT